MTFKRLVTQVSYDDVLVIAELLRDLPAPWYVSGGWAIDLFLGAVTREHADLEIGIARNDQGALQSELPGWRFYKILPRPGDGEIVPWPAGECLDLPIHQIILQCEDAGPPEFEFFLNEVWDGEWHFRRDLAIRRVVTESYLQSPSGIPVTAPEIQLLYKARGHRPKDEHDFQAVLPHLDAAQRSWLRTALQRFLPEDPWLSELTACSTE